MKMAMFDLSVDNRLITLGAETEAEADLLAREWIKDKYGNKQIDISILGARANLLHSSGGRFIFDSTIIELLKG